MFTTPGKKLLFMGSEFGQWQEWGHERSLDWHLLEGDPKHGQLQRCVGDLARLYREEPALHEGDAEPFGFEWVDVTDWESSIISYLRRARDGREVVVVANLTPIVRDNYRIGVPQPGFWREAFNSDAEVYGGSGAGNFGGVESRPLPMHGRMQSVNLTLPPLSVLILTPEPSRED
jgi:1,4-alpha-glucan branching enzyme